jgi:hypothetical protein
MIEIYGSNIAYLIPMRMEGIFKRERIFIDYDSDINNFELSI